MDRQEDNGFCYDLIGSWGQAGIRTRSVRRVEVKPTRGWAIVTPRGAYVNCTVSRTMAEAWFAGQMEYGCPDKKRLKEDGFRAVRVQITEESDA